MVDQVDSGRVGKKATVRSSCTRHTSRFDQSGATLDGKAPQQLPKGFWAKCIKEFEATKIEQRHRSFPVTTSSVALRRCWPAWWWEKETTNHFTPGTCSLGRGDGPAQPHTIEASEPVSRHTQSKQVNPWARHDDGMSGVPSLETSASLIKKEKYIPEPQNLRKCSRSLTRSMQFAGLWSSVGGAKSTWSSSSPSSSPT